MRDHSRIAGSRTRYAVRYAVLPLNYIPKLTQAPKGFLGTFFPDEGTGWRTAVASYALPLRFHYPVPGVPDSGPLCPFIGHGPMLRGPDSDRRPPDYLSGELTSALPRNPGRQIAAASNSLGGFDGCCSSFFHDSNITHLMRAKRANFIFLFPSICHGHSCIPLQYVFLPFCAPPASNSDHPGIDNA